MSGLGRHILAEFYGCEFEKLNDPELLKRVALDAVAQSGATIVSHHFKTFSPQGVSGVIVIAESHLSFHTWPEHGYAAVDYFTCGDRIDLHLAVDLLERALQPSHTDRKLHWRGSELSEEPYCPTCQVASDAPDRGGASATEVASDQERWVTEYHLQLETQRRILGYQYLVTGEVASRKSAFQTITVAESPAYGRMMLIDGYMMTTERDEFVYHEMLGHVPLVHHALPRRVCIIGGGDGGLLREVLRHESVEQVDLVEIDEAVVQMSRAHLPTIGSRFDDPRAALHITDGAKFMAAAPEGRYDAVLVDSTDPIGPGRVLFEVPFFEAVRRALAPGGVVATQALSPWLQPVEQRALFGALGRVFPHVLAYHATVPTYPGGQWVFALAQVAAPDLTGRDRTRARTVALDCKYYTPELQLAAFHLPRFIAENTVDVARAVREGEADAAEGFAGLTPRDGDDSRPRA